MIISSKMDIENLIKLSKICKKGFTVECTGHELKQYTDYNKPFIVSYRTIIKITENKINYKNMGGLPYNCIIGGWHDSDTNTYYIELNLTFNTKEHAITVAKAFNQKAIYDIRTDNVIEV